MGENLLQCDPEICVEHQHLLYQVKQVQPLGLQDLIYFLSVFLQRSAVSPHIFPVRGAVVPLENSATEMSRPRPGRHLGWYRAQDPLHHGEVLPVLVGLEQGVAQRQLEHDAADGPDVTGLSPAQLQDHLRGPVVPRAHHGAVVLPVEGR